MSEVDPGTEQPPRTAGAALRARREEQGLDLAEVVRRTRVPTRHLQSIEAGDYGSLPSSTYAVGFARAYARAVGADEVATAAQVRREVERLGRTRPEYEPYVTADPARVPSRALAVVTLGLALAVAVLAGLYFGTDLFRRDGATGGDAAVVASVPTPSSAPARPAAATPSSTGPAPSSTGQVRLTANDEVWVRVYDAADKTLKLGTMKAGESFDVPRDADRPVVNVGRPDKLTVTLDGRALPPLGTGERPVKAPIGAAALATRLSGAPAAADPNALTSPS